MKPNTNICAIEITFMQTPMPSMWLAIGLQPSTLQTHFLSTLACGRIMLRWERC